MVTMFLIYPGMTDFREVEITGPAPEAGYCYVRPAGTHGDPVKVAAVRLVDRATRDARIHVQIIEEKDDLGRWVARSRTTQG